MNGPDHYKAAEELLARDHSYTIQGHGDGRYGTPGPSERDIAMAQAHATLALAAATAAKSDAMAAKPRMDAAHAWREVIQ